MGIVLSAGKYIHWGVVSISLTNFLIIVGMIVLFALALVLPFPGAHDREQSDEDES
jgi:high-affinity Fe2+/Pb2+ permease